MLLMAPRRNSNTSSSIVPTQQQQAQQQQQSPLHHLHHLQSQQQSSSLQQHQQQTLLLTTAFYRNVGEEELADNHLLDFNQFDTIGNMSPMQQTTNNSSTVNNNNHGGGGAAVNNTHSSHSNANNNSEQQFTRCCCPNGDCFKIDSLISLDGGVGGELGDCVRVICNNENCNVGQFMHRECFESWEQGVLVTLKSIGRARSWSDRQRSQNLWTKKGYDLVYKACGCKCGRGHIRKDLEWSAPPAVAKNGLVNGGGHFATTNGSGQQRMVNGAGNGGVTNNCNEDEEKKKKKKRNRNNQKPTLALAPLNPSGYHPNSQQQQQQQQLQNGHANVNGNMNNNCSPIVANSNNINGNIISPNPNVGVIGSGLHHANNNQQQLQQQPPTAQVQQHIVASLNNIIISNGNVLGLDLRDRDGSLSSSGGGSGSTSPSASQSSGDISISPIHIQQQLQQQQQQQQQHHQQHLQLQPYQHSLLQNGLTKSILNGINGVAPLLVKQQQQQQSALVVGNGNGLNHMQFDQQHLTQQQKNKEVELYSERVRSTSGCNGIFSRRLDFSSFNLLPKTRLNSYQVKIEDEGNHGNDETRLFILSSLAQSQMSRVACILCEEPMLVFDRYPLVDGSFFLSPKQHSSGCIEVKYEGRTLFLTCVCMGCLDGTSSNRVISCRFCGELWDGSNLVLGTMYSYDIFAAMPCCAERLKCNNCFKLLFHPQQRFNFYSDYSRCVTCPFCTTQDTHFVKPLSFCYAKNITARHQQIA